MRQRKRFAVWLCGSVAWLAAATLALQAQFRAPPPTPLAKMPPLLYLRLAGPPGMKVTIYRGAVPVSYDAPSVIGVRPGYCYRLALSNIRGFPGATFYPTLDVHGSLALIGQLRNADFPAALLFHEEDFAKAEDGGLIRKAIVLEHPEAALPIASRPDVPIELAAAAGRNLLQAASRHGATLAIMTLGQRKFTAEEMTDAVIPGTLLAPDEKSLAWPSVPPTLPWGCYPVYDPLHGPPHVHEWVAIPDGGDSNLRAGYNRAGQLSGLDPSDTIAEYVDPLGNKKIVPSNRVSVCVPRFILLRVEQNVGTQTAALGTDLARANRLGSILIARQGFAEERLPIQPETTLGRMKPSSTLNDVGTAVTGRVNGLEVVATLRLTETLDGRCPPPGALVPQRPLRIVKWPDCAGANVGDIVTFSLRYTNLGGEPITDVVVSDSLTTRFEYVPGSQRTDRAAGFTVQANEAGSSLLRWEFAGALAPGASGLITFQVRIR